MKTSLKNETIISGNTKIVKRGNTVKVFRSGLLIRIYKLS
jgi:hypothetical protein